ncbi:MAG TPA: hypothetical protein VGL77_20855 [Armatimonadota bacterium]|jgi:hypothetical protein
MHRTFDSLFLAITLLLGLTVLVQAATPVPAITDLPAALDPAYDITWQVSGSVPPGAVCVLAVEGRATLSVGREALVWSRVDGGVATVLRRVAWTGMAGTPSTLTLKRRVGTVAVLLNHRLCFTAPLPAASQGTVAFTAVPVGVRLREARYRRVAPGVFGDDFMRPEGIDRFLASFRGEWVDDDVWQVASYQQRDNPGQQPTDPHTGARLVNPWQLSCFPSAETTTNGFWYLYTGVGPSWVVANDSLVPAFWDRYAVQAAVRPDYESEVGLLAAYQDTKNYLLFRWTPRTAATPRAELVAIVAGQARVLATHAGGFDPEQWYTLRLNLSWQRVQVLVDGVLLCDVPNPGSVEGRIGLYALGAVHPQRPTLDDVTASMFLFRDVKTGQVTNDAADAMRTTSYILFDDVRVEPWETVDGLSTSPFQTTKTGTWTATPDDTLTAVTAGSWLTPVLPGERQAVSTRLWLPANGRARLLLQPTGQGTGYSWTLSATAQTLAPSTSAREDTPVDRDAHGLPTGQWVDLRVERDGPYLVCLANGARTLHVYDPALQVDRAGVQALTPGVQVQRFRVTPLPERWQAWQVHAGFNRDKWLLTWASAESDWTPAFTPPAAITPLGTAHDVIGPAAPYPTSTPGLYWHKGGHYGDVRITLPITPTLLAGQTLILASDDDLASGYRLRIERDGVGGRLQCWRRQALLGSYAFPVTEHSLLRIERLGAYLIVRAQALDPADCVGEPEVLAETRVLVYRDPQPLQTPHIGFTVTDARLPAAYVQIASSRRQETFETAPVGWLTQSGVWKVMARYSCQPKWNWYGGFGAGTPTVWSKLRLDGDQTVEAYLGVKMQYDNMTEGEAQRFRDFNVTICSDGAHLNRGYTVIRAGLRDGQRTTMLLRNGVVVQTSTALEHLLPTGNAGHRQWFATRLEKRGAALRVYLDNSLAFTYVDPDPLPGGYVGLWSLNNGIMLGRVNLSAERMTPGSPQAALPLAPAPELSPLPILPITVAGRTVTPASFERGFDGWTGRSGFTGRLQRVRTTAPGQAKTYLAVTNSYPAGDCAVSLPPPRDLLATPYCHLEYAFDAGAQVNLYARVQGHWYEIMLTAPKTSDPGVTPAGALPVVADGHWQTLDADVGGLLARAVAQTTGATPTILAVEELVIAEWTTEAALRAYGLGLNPGGTTLRFDNAAWVPREAQR